MVSSLTIIGMIFTALLCIATPTLLFAYVNRRAKFTGIALVAGIVSFFVLQVVIRIPLLAILSTQEWYISFSENVFGISIFLGLTAALFETVGRVLFIRIFLKGKYSYGTGLAHGIGHGGIEAVILIAVNYVVYVFYAIMINNGTFDAMMVGAAAEPMRALKDTLIETNSILFFVAGIERFMTMFVHIGLSVLVVEGFMKGQVWKYSLIAIAIHGSLDFLAVFLQLNGVGTLVMELLVLAYAVGLAYYVYKAKDRFPKIENKDMEVE